ncbi:hypothetical protein [Xanthobacter aminoxidans]|uniref:Uncharacterized protein n=1 Tax=Xanthobacter aminoxidans TaxID=186280 RepID=A0ABW6ZBB7_9HYPH
MAIVQETLTGPGSTAPFTPSEARPWLLAWPFSAWVLLGSSWSGPLYLERSPDGGTTWVPIVVGNTQLYLAKRIGCTPAEEIEAGVSWRWTAGANFSGTANVRLS